MSRTDSGDSGPRSAINTVARSAYFAVRESKLNPLTPDLA